MRIACVLAILATASIAYADHKERRAPCVCAPPTKSTPPATLLEVRWHSGSTKVVSKLFSTGMWTRQLTEYDGRTTTRGGKLDSSYFDETKAALKIARWKVGKPAAGCQGDRSEATEFYVSGHKRYTAWTCGGAVDDETQKLIERLGSRIEFAQPLEIDEEISISQP